MKFLIFFNRIIVDSMSGMQLSQHKIRTNLLHASKKCRKRHKKKQQRSACTRQRTAATPTFSTNPTQSHTQSPNFLFLFWLHCSSHTRTQHSINAHNNATHPIIVKKRSTTTTTRPHKIPHHNTLFYYYRSRSLQQLSSIDKFWVRVAAASAFRVCVSYFSCCFRWCPPPT